MLLTKVSGFTGIEHTLDLPINQAQLDRWKGGEKIQDVFPFLTADQREFIMTGVTAEEWSETFGKEE